MSGERWEILTYYSKLGTQDSNKLSFETISVTEPGNDLFSIITDFFPQTGDVHVNGAVEYHYFIGLNSGKYLFARKNPVFIL